MKVAELSKHCHFVDILKKYTQWESIPYANDFMCQECGGSRYGTLSFETPLPKPTLVGWCETYNGFMGIFECPNCGSLFRFHPGFPADTFDEFDFRLHSACGEVTNGKDLQNKYSSYFNNKRESCDDYEEWKANIISKYGIEWFNKLITL